MEPKDFWIVQSRKPESDKGWEFGYRFDRLEFAKRFKDNYAPLFPECEWRIVKQVTTWEVME